MPLNQAQPKYLSDPAVAARYDVTPRSLDRWDAATDAGQLDFPKPIYIRGRKFRELAALERFDRNRAAAAATDAARIRQELVRRQHRETEAKRRQRALDAESNT